MFTKEVLLSASTFGKQTGCKGVLTSEEAYIRSKRTHTLVTFCSFEENKFFFADDHCFGVRVLPDHWVPCTTMFPLSVKPRPGLEDGFVDTIEKYIFVFGRVDEQIKTIQELVDILNSKVQKEDVYIIDGFI